MVSAIFIYFTFLNNQLIQQSPQNPGLFHGHIKICKYYIWASFLSSFIQFQDVYSYLRYNFLLYFTIFCAEGWHDFRGEAEEIMQPEDNKIVK